MGEVFYQAHLYKTQIPNRKIYTKEGFFMACYYLNADIISRGDGGSVTAAAAYISGEKLRDSYDGKIHDRSYRKDVKHKEILLPPEAPLELFDRQTFLDALNVSERWSNSQMARIYKIALPNELSFDEQVALAKEFALVNFINISMCADFAVHEGLLYKNREFIRIEPVYERQNNPHAHLIVPFRMVGKNGFHRTKTQTRYMNNPAYLISLRKNWEILQNKEFERLGLPVRVSHKSLAAQGIDREPTKHIGAAAMALEQRGIQTERGDEYREIIARNKERERERERQRGREHERERERNRGRDR
jgi:hypothetical protein